MSLHQKSQYEFFLFNWEIMSLIVNICEIKRSQKNMKL